MNENRSEIGDGMRLRVGRTDPELIANREDSATELPAHGLDDRYSGIAPPS